MKHLLKIVMDFYRYLIKNKKRKSCSQKHLAQRHNKSYTLIKEGKAMHGILDVAQWFLHKEPMSHKKLQKLAYYSYAWYYTLTDKRLFDGQFEAWIHGPVNRQLYVNYHGNGWNNISPNSYWVNPFSKEENYFLESVYQSFGNFSADELESMTHQELPWQEARNGIPANEPCTNIIRDSTMKDYYLKIGEANQIE